MIVLDICLSDIPAEKITTGKNGKKYCKMCLTEMRQRDKWGNTHTVYMSQSKEERAARVEKQWVGKGTDYASPADSANEPPVNFNKVNDNDLPW